MIYPVESAIHLSNNLSLMGKGSDKLSANSVIKEQAKTVPGQAQFESYMYLS